MGTHIGLTTASPLLPLFKGGRTVAGFTLIEMLIVISIIVILMAFLLPVIGSVQQRCENARGARAARRHPERAAALQRRLR